MPSISSERTSVKRRASVASRRAYASAPTRVAWNRPRPGDDDAARQHLVAVLLAHRLRLAGEQRLVDLEPVRHRARSRRPRPGRRRGARAGRRARPRRPRSRAPRRRARPARAAPTAPRGGRACAWRATPARSRSAALNTSTNPKSPSRASPNTRISTNIVPRIALNRVKRLARAISHERAARALVGDVDQPALLAVGDLGGASARRARCGGRARALHASPPRPPRRPTVVAAVHRAEERRSEHYGCSRHGHLLPPSGPGDRPRAARGAGGPRAPTA